MIFCSNPKRVLKSQKSNMTKFTLKRFPSQQTQGLHHSFFLLHLDRDNMLILWPECNIAECQWKIVNEPLDLLSSRQFHSLWRGAAGSSVRTLYVPICRALLEGANNNCNFTNRIKWLIMTIINESIYPLLFTFSILMATVCVRVIILHTVGRLVNQNDRISAN